MADPKSNRTGTENQRVINPLLAPTRTTSARLLTPNLASTRNAAHVAGLEKVTGTLEVGKIADVLIVDGNPLQDLQALANVHLVVHDGQMIFPSRDQNSQD